MSQELNCRFWDSRIQLIWDVKVTDILKLICYAMIVIGALFLINDYPLGQEPPVMTLVKNVLIGFALIASGYYGQGLIKKRSKLSKVKE